MKERRKFRRVSAAIKIVCKVMGIKGENTLKTMDISGGGLKVYLKEKVSIGTQVELGLMMPPEEQVFFALGRVAWQFNARSAYGYQTGVEFVRMDIGQKMKLMRLVREMLKRGTP
jgi:c-di-GMP-binding flagellar brake protein YcgR